MIHSIRCVFSCRFTKQSVRCKQALVYSSCGEEAGDFAFYVAKLADQRHTKKCELNVNAEYEGTAAFLYNSLDSFEFSKWYNKVEFHYKFDEDIVNLNPFHFMTLD